MSLLLASDLVLGTEVYIIGDVELNGIGVLLDLMATKMSYNSNRYIKGNSFSVINCIL